MGILSSGNLTGLDWFAVGLFLAVVVGIAAWVKFGQKGREDFFLAGRSMGWFVVMFSTFATLFSTISFVSVPGESYKNGLMTFLTDPILLICYPIAIAIFLRFYLAMGSFTIFEYLERRYNSTLRFYGSMVFCLGRFIYGGTVFFAAAKLLHGLIGLDERLVIVLVGVFTIAYCTTGGMKAVMLTDVLQGIILIVGIVAVVFMMLKAVNFDIAGVYNYASSNGHGFERLASPEFYKSDLHTRYSFWVVLWTAMYYPIMMVSSDQTLIQRLMAAKNYKTAVTGIYGNLLLSLPVVAMLYFVGIGLFYFYGNGYGDLPEGTRPDYVMGHFVSTMLPAPLPGIILAGMLAALMSTIDSNVNTIANVVYSDFLGRLRIVKEGSKHEMLICRILTVVAGFLCVGLALLLVYAEKGTTTTVFEVIKIGGVVAGGPIFLAFTLGILSKRVSGKTMLVGLLAGWILNIILPYTVYYNVAEADRISSFWISFPGIMTTLLLTLSLSVVWPNTKNIDGLTVWTLKKK